MKKIISLILLFYAFCVQAQNDIYYFNIGNSIRADAYCNVKFDELMLDRQYILKFGLINNSQKKIHLDFTKATQGVSVNKKQIDINPADTAIIEFTCLINFESNGYHAYYRSGFNSIHIGLHGDYVVQDKNYLGWHGENYQLDTTVAGSVKLHTFRFCNKSKNSITIQNVIDTFQNKTLSVVDFTHTPIQPEDSGYITVQFSPGVVEGSKYQSTEKFTKKLVVQFDNLNLNKEINLIAIAYQKDAPNFKWLDSVSHDLKNIPEGIPVSTKYFFKNIGKSPLIITAVLSTCGCISNDWIKDPVMPGQIGWVVTNFNAAKTGAFQKANTVISNAGTPSVKLYIKGNVVSLQSKMEIFDGGNLNAGKLKNDTTYEFKLHFYNTGLMPLEIQSIECSDLNLTFEYSNEEVLYSDTSDLTVKFRTYYTGSVQKLITIKYKGSRPPYLDEAHQIFYEPIADNYLNQEITEGTEIFSLNAYVLNDSGYAEIEWVDPVEQYGSVRKYVQAAENSDTVYCEFTFKNIGNKPLIIDSLYTSNRQYKVAISDSIVNPGDTSVFVFQILGPFENFNHSYGCEIFSNAIREEHWIYAHIRK